MRTMPHTHNLMGTPARNEEWSIPESRMKGNFPVRFGERGGETRRPQGRKVRPASTLRTAGFLISSYKHILRANTDEQGRNTLTPDDKGRLAKNFKGYDIS